MNRVGLMENVEKFARKQASFPTFSTGSGSFHLKRRKEKHWLVNGTGDRAPGFERRILDWAMWYGKPESTIKE